MEEKTRKILSKLEAQCARREYCRSDIMAKAQKLTQGDAEACAEVVESLVSQGYVDDLRYACAFAREKASLTGWGPVKIRLALSAKKIDGSVIGAALEEIDTDKASDKLEKLMAAKWKSLGADPQARLKLLKFALSRGYEYDAVRKAADKICSNYED